MRIALTLALLLVAGVLVAAFFTLGRLISGEQLREQIVDETGAATGRPVTIGGRIELGLLPTPTLSFANARFLAADGEAGPTLEVDRVDLGVAAFPLLRGEVEVEEVRLVRPRLRFEPDDDRPVGPLELLAGQSFLPPWTGVSRLTVVDGEVVIGRVAATALILERVDLEVETRGDRGPFFIEGSLLHRGQPLVIEARLGLLTDDPNTTLQLDLGTAEAADTDLALGYSGVVSLDRLSYLRGQMSFTGSGLDAALALLGPPGWAPPDGIPDAPFRLEAVIESEDGEGQLADLQAELGPLQGRGRLGFALDEPPRFALQLDLPRVEAEWLGRETALLEPLAALAGRATGEIDLSIESVVRQRAAARGIRLTLGLDADGTIEVRQARAVLPGDTDVSIKGRLGLEPEPRLDGRITAVTDRFGELLSVFDAGVPAAAAARVRTLSLDAGLSATAGGFRLSEMDARLDASAITGSLSYQPGARPRIRAAVAADRLSVERYAPDLGPRDLGALLLDRVGEVDLDLELTLERLTIAAGRWTDVVVDAQAEGGRVVLDRVHGALADAEVQVEGWLDPAREQAELAATLRSPRPGPLLRRIGLAPAVSLARIGELEIDATAKGWTDGARIGVRARLGELRSTAEGRAALEDDDALQIELEVDLAHPRYSALLGDLGLADPAAAAGEPLSGAGKVRLVPEGKVELTGQLALGATRVTGQVGLLPDEAGERIDARLSFGEPRLETLLPLAALAGYRLDLGLLDAPVPGAWPPVRLETAPLRAFDGRIVLSGKGGLAGEGLEAEISGDDGLIRVERATLRLTEGQVDLEATLNAREASPQLALALQTRGVAVARLLDALGVPPGLTGRLDLYGELAGIGETPHDLLRSLAGDIGLSVRDGTVALPRPAPADPPPRGVPHESVQLDLLEAQFDVRRGLAEVTRLDLDTPESGWQGEGLIDLLVWIVDLSLIASGPDPRRIRIVGPPDRLQTRVLEPAAASPHE